MARVFLSHSSRDEAASRWLADWLVRQGFEAPFLDFDKHSGIPPGADWERTLYREIASSQALLIVQSSHWNASKWCFAEYTQARALGKPVFQLVGVPGLLPEAVGADEDPINRDLQQLDLRRDRDAALESLAHELTVLALQDHGGFTWDPARPPYPGLLSFDWEDAAVFFGRDEEIRELIERLQVVRIQGSGRLVVLLGASGSGKSSLLRAGVLPRLARSGHQWLPLSPFRPRVDPCAALAQAMANALQGKRDAVALDRQLREATGDEQLAGLLNHLVAELRQVSQRPEAQILISVDQAEELFTDCAPEQSRWFLTLLSQALTACPSIQVVFTLRSDFLGLLQAAPGLTAPLQEVSLQPFPLDRIPDVIRGPARLAGITVEDSFVQAAIRDANTEDALPLLAFALREICERKGADRLLSLTDYETLADGAEQLSPLENAVRRAADGVLAICQPTTEELQALRDAFVPSMVCINDQKDYSRRPARWNSLPPLAWPLLSHLVDARLLLVEQREDERWLEVSHEALLRKWPVLRQWIDACRDLLVGCQQLEPALRDWQQASEPDKTASLLTGLNLARASTWLEERPQQLSPELRRFIAASLDHRNRLIRLRRRTQQQVVGGLSFLLLLASGAWVWGEIARQQAHQAQTRQFQSTHLSLLEDDPMQSVVHGLAAMARLRGNLQQALPLAISLNRAVERNGLQRLWLSGQDEVWSLAETPSGRVISGGRDGSLRFWRADGQPEPGTLQTSHSAGVRGLVVISDQEWWTAGDDGLLQHWIGGLRQGPPIVTGHGSVQSLVRTPDGQLLSAGIDGFLRRWDLRTGQSLGRPLRSGHLEVWSLVVLPNGDWVSGGREGRLQWWREGRRRGMPIPSGQGAVSALVALPGNAILSGGDDGRLRYWDSVGHLLRSFNSGHNSIMSLLRLRQGSILSGGSERLTEAESSSIRSWLPPKTGLDNQVLPGQIESLSLVELCNGDLISGASDGALYHWRDGHRLGQPIQTTHRRVDALTLLPSGDLVSGGDDGTLQVWRNGQVVARAPTDQGGVTSLATLVDGSLLSGGRDGSIRHLQLEDGALRRISSMHSHHGAVWAIAPLPDGDVLSGGDDGLIRRWRRGRQQGIALKTPHTTVVSLVVRSNGDWVSGGSGGDIQLWREGRRLGDFFHVDSGSVWSLVERRNRQIVSANGDGTIFTYPTPARAIASACRQLPVASSALDPSSIALQEARKLCSEQRDLKSRQLPAISSSWLRLGWP